jgi:hypothetical protein
MKSVTHVFLARLLDRLVRHLPLVPVDRVGPGGIEGLALDPGLLDRVVQRVGQEAVEVDLKSNWSN